MTERLGNWGWKLGDWCWGLGLGAGIWGPWSWGMGVVLGPGPGATLGAGNWGWSKELLLFSPVPSQEVGSQALSFWQVHGGEDCLSLSW